MTIENTVSSWKVEMSIISYYGLKHLNITCALYLPSPENEHTQSENSEQQRLELSLLGSSKLLYRHPAPPGPSKFPGGPRLQRNVRECTLQSRDDQIKQI